MAEQYGYAGKILRVDLSAGHISTFSTGDYAPSFIGGRGVAAKIHWDEVPADTDAFDPENRLVIMTGPLCGIPGLAGSRWQVSGKSPILNRFSYCNLGGAWGARLKFAGYDGLVVQGKADKPVYLLIDDDQIEICNGAHLTGKGAISTREILKAEHGASFCVMAIGPAGENRIRFATLLADSDSSGSGGMGAVMGSKNLKAILVRGTGKITTANRERLGELRKRIKKLKFDLSSLPTMITASIPAERLTKDVCFGCINGCVRETYSPTEGTAGKYMCQSAIFYEVRAHRFYGKSTEVPYRANKMCDDFGMDTRAVETMIMWLSRCHKSGILTEQDTGLPFSKIGSLEFIETFLKKLSFREGIGDVLAEGTSRAAEAIGMDSDSLITEYMVKTGENELYGPRLYLTTGLFYAVEPRQPIQQLHEISPLGMMWAAREMGLLDHYMTSGVLRKIGKRFWGSEIAADFSTYEGKAMAAVMIQDRQYVKELMILCDFSWPNIHSPATDDHVGDPTLESRILEAVTGEEMDEAGLNSYGAKVFNLQRAILAREGHRGRSHDVIDDFNYSSPLRGDFGNPECLVPGNNGMPFARKGMVVDRDEFERLKDEYYAIRGWNIATGLQTRGSLKKIGLEDVADQLGQEGLLGLS